MKLSARDWDDVDDLPDDPERCIRCGHVYNYLKSEGSRYGMCQNCIDLRRRIKGRKLSTLNLMELAFHSIGARGGNGNYAERMKAYMLQEARIRAEMAERSRLAREKWSTRKKYP